MKTKEQILQNCIIEGTMVKLPEEQLDRKLYLEVAKSLNLIGGKWKGKPVFGFIFQEDPTELLKQIANGESRNLKKEFQFFATPDNLADELVRLAQIEESHTILEPSAGQGSIMNAIHKLFPNKNVNWCELMSINQTFCQRIHNATFVCEDFFNHNVEEFYDRIIAKPPFAKNQDIDHINKMFECLKSGGRLVSISSTHWQISSNKKETAFREWVEDIRAEIKEIPAGTFKESGTTISSLIIIINK